MFFLRLECDFKRLFGGMWTEMTTQMGPSHCWKELSVGREEGLGQGRGGVAPSPCSSDMELQGVREVYI